MFKELYPHGIFGIENGKRQLAEKIVICNYIKIQIVYFKWANI